MEGGGSCHAPAVASEDSTVGGAGKRGLPPVSVSLHFCYSAFMKTTVTMTSRGVVTLPAKLRRTLGLKADDLLIAETTPEGLLLRPAVTLPVEIYSEKRVREFDAAEAELDKALPRRRKRAR
jgi:AbrB family looped-hinge helix DNA binding protein